jgi:hypothetical protein
MQFKICQGAEQPPMQVEFGTMSTLLPISLLPFHFERIAWLPFPQSQNRVDVGALETNKNFLGPSSYNGMIKSSLNYSIDL